MRFVIQVVDNASVAVDGKTIGSIGKGFLVLAGIGGGDSKAVADKMVSKLVNMRIFKDDNGKTNLSVKHVGGEVLMISQFTLYADCRRGNRPSFTNAAPPDEASSLFDYCVDRVREELGTVETGEFGAHMIVSLVNNGPFTIVLDSSDLKIT